MGLTAHCAQANPVSTLLVGFDSAWTAANRGAVVGLIRHDHGGFLPLGLPFVANFDTAKQTIISWQTEHNFERTIVLIDQPIIVKNAKGQRPVEHLVSSLVSRRYGGMQPANTARRGMFDDGAPIWEFLDHFGGPADILTYSKHTEIFETYPVLTIMARGWILSDDHKPHPRPSGRLPKYNPARRSTFRRDDWDYLCGKLSGFFNERGVTAIANWIESIRLLELPQKADQDRLDACLCLLVAMDMADGKDCMVIGEQASGYIVTTAAEMMQSELTQRCIQTERDPARWIRSFLI